MYSVDSLLKSTLRYEEDKHKYSYAHINKNRESTNTVKNLELHKIFSLARILSDMEISLNDFQIHILVRMLCENDGGAITTVKPNSRAVGQTTVLSLYIYFMIAYKEIFNPQNKHIMVLTNQEFMCINHILEGLIDDYTNLYIKSSH